MSFDLVMSVFRSSNPGFSIVLLSMLLSVVFLADAGIRIAGIEHLVPTFAKLVPGQGWHDVTAVFEVAGAFFLLIGVIRFYAAVSLACMTAGAMAKHLLVIGGDPIPAIVLFLLSTIVAFCAHPVRE
jgi:putative oxidoreductase